MPATPHTERHFTASESIRDLVIGMSDGLTVPFALAAGLSGAVLGNQVIVTAGLAEEARRTQWNDQPNGDFFAANSFLSRWHMRSQRSKICGSEMK